MTERPQTFDYRAFLQTAPSRPGVYQMYDEDERVLYVGKAKHLQKRLASYFRGQQSSKTAALVSHIHHIEVVTTHSETEALLLEQTLIKEHRPPYNILLRDDKSYPYIFLSSDDEFPRFAFHRGGRKGEGRYFGPYPNSRAVRETLALLQKVFLVRQCEDSYFRNRTRPCLQYQIKRCKAPCVGLVNRAEYQQDVTHSVLLLEGKNKAVMNELSTAMDRAAADLAFEQAAEYRDQIGRLRHIQEQQAVNVSAGDVDIIGVATKAGVAVISVLFVRAGRVLGQHHYYPPRRWDESETELLESFLGQYYIRWAASRDFPREIIIPELTVDLAALEQAVTEVAGYAIKIAHRVRADRRQWQLLASNNAELELIKRQAETNRGLSQWQRLQQVLALENGINRIECFDISHTMGEATVASCVVFADGGPKNSDYRRFNIEGVTAGDDYGAMAQALERRYLKCAGQEGALLPDLILIDGGLGQLGAAQQGLQQLGIGGVTLIGVAKGVTRKPGLERLLTVAGEEIELKHDDPALHLVQRIRDEAHRFAITGHRRRRQKARKASSLEQVPGIGAKRRTMLLRYFGGLQGVMNAPVRELQKVPGISARLAEQIYSSLHG